MFTHSPIRTTSISLCALALAILGGTIGGVAAGEPWVSPDKPWNDIEGISSDDANRDAEAIRRNQNREDYRLNPINENVAGQPVGPASAR